MLLKTEGLPHQNEDLANHWQDPEWGRLWEMGVGKTWPTLIESAMLFHANRIDVLIIAGPKAAAKNWVLDQIPKHLPDDVNPMVWAYSVPDRNKVFHRQAIERLRDHWKARRGLAVLSVSYEGVLTDECKELLKELMGARKLPDGTWVGNGRSMLVADESSYLGNDDSQRTQRMYSLGSIAGYRRILEGTPVTNDPRNVYPQMKFLNRDYWNRYRIFSFREFTTTFCKIVKSKHLTVKTKGGREVMIPKVVGYQNLDQLNRMLLAGASRLTTEEAGIHLPEKTYTRLRFELHPKQRKVYDDLKKTFMAELDGGLFVSAPLAMTRVLRLQQVASGYLPVEREDGHADLIPIVPPKENPRLELLLERLETVPHQTIVFSRFTPEIDMILDAIPSIKQRAVRFDGKTSDRERERSLKEFLAGDAKFLVGNTVAAGRSLTLVNAKRTIYVSNDFKYGDRAQSEKRAHRIGQKDPCFYDDIEAIGTVDGKIISALQNKHEIAAQVTGDTLRDWIG
jgi:SNF2 family DNA or RNA helicase